MSRRGERLATPGDTPRLIEAHALLPESARLCQRLADLNPDVLSDVRGNVEGLRSVAADLRRVTDRLRVLTTQHRAKIVIESKRFGRPFPFAQVGQWIRHLEAALAPAEQFFDGLRAAAAKHPAEQILDAVEIPDADSQ